MPGILSQLQVIDLTCRLLRARRDAGGQLKRRFSGRARQGRLDTDLDGRQRRAMVPMHSGTLMTSFQSNRRCSPDGAVAAFVVEPGG
jgi:hypothetical protein